MQMCMTYSVLPNDNSAVFLNVTNSMQNVKIKASRAFFNISHTSHKDLFHSRGQKESRAITNPTYFFTPQILLIRKEACLP